MKNSMKVLSFIFVATIALTTAQTVSASTEDTRKVRFSCCAAGRSFVLWNFLWAEAGPDSYIELATGFIACGGSAHVEEDGSGFPYAALDPGSVCCIGFLGAKWTHGEQSYRLSMVFYPTEETMGFFWPEADYFAIGNWLPPGIPTMMKFKGILVENGDRQPISGGAILVTLERQYDYTPPEAKTISLLLFIDLGEELPDDERWLIAAVGWVDRDITLPPSPEPVPVEKARVFWHSVKLLDS